MNVCGSVFRGWGIGGMRRKWGHNLFAMDTRECGTASDRQVYCDNCAPQNSTTVNSQYLKH